MSTLYCNIILCLYATTHKFLYGTIEFPAKDKWTDGYYNLTWKKVEKLTLN